MGRAKSLPKDQQARATITQWSALKTHFGKSYKDINDDQYLEAVSLLARLPLDGEIWLDGEQVLLDKPQPQAPQTGIVLTPDELALLYAYGHPAPTYTKADTTYSADSTAYWSGVKWTAYNST
ncbi:hypothetical protein A1D19_09135 [Lonepinella koalarum]|uniref:hypothetical protein n=1 Tax=Lonepinella koalarum TaxID=53417 RepID=UPI00244AB4C8|nr:hypothetical protein [Lonepinella koalarum]MDH2927293.1 hypothetical protein [Lonepinella koalarum]